MSDLRSRLRADLTEAMRGGDRETVRTLRTLLSAIANAEAQPAPDDTESLATDSPIAGAISGLAATEVARRELTADDLRAMVRAERDEHLSAADSLGSHESAASHRAAADLLSRYLD